MPDSPEALSPKKEDKGMVDHAHWWTLGLALAATLASALSAWNFARSAEITKDALRLATNQFELAQQVRQDNIESAKRQQGGG